MRSREEIEKELDNAKSALNGTNLKMTLAVEVLLDIRDLLDDKFEHN